MLTDAKSKQKRAIPQQRFAQRQAARPNRVGVTPLTSTVLNYCLSIQSRGVHSHNLSLFLSFFLCESIIHPSSASPNLESRRQFAIKLDEIKQTNETTNTLT